MKIDDLLIEEDLSGTPEEIIKRLAGYRLPASNGWGTGTVVGAWKLRRPYEPESHVRILLACPNAENPVQLFNEDARIYLPNPKSPLEGVKSDYEPTSTRIP